MILHGKIPPTSDLTLPRLFQYVVLVFFFQAEDGIRDLTVTGVQTCALPISPFQWIDPSKIPQREWLYRPHYIRQFVSLTVSTGGVGKSSLLIAETLVMVSAKEIGRASCRERV